MGKLFDSSAVTLAPKTGKPHQSRLQLRVHQVAVRPGLNTSIFRFELCIFSIFFLDIITSLVILLVGRRSFLFRNPAVDGG